MTTRLYICLAWVCYCVVIVYTVLPEMRNTITVHNPSLADYESLQANQDTVTCLCSSLTIPYSTFVAVLQPNLHQVCSSPFVSATWISAVFGDTTVNRSMSQAFLSAHFRLLAALCASSQQIITEAMKDFALSQFASVSLLPRSEVAKQINDTFTEFYMQAPNILRRTLAFILDTTLANQVMTVYESNWHVTPGLWKTVTKMPCYYGKFQPQLSYQSSALSH